MLNGKPQTKEEVSHRWWNLPKELIPDSIESIMTTMKNNQTRRQTQLIISTRLYGNLGIIGPAGITLNKGASNQSASKDRVTYNVCQSVVDTITSKIAKNKPKPYFLSSDGDYKLKRKAIKLGKFIDGCFYQNDVYTLAVDVFRDACVWGTGVIHVYSLNGKIKTERVLIQELYVDEMEGFYGKPRQMHRVKLIDREVLAEMYPKHREKIINLPQARPENLQAEQLTDQIAVSESWHLKSGPDAKDGMHVITIPGTPLLVEDYDSPSFPFAFFHWNKRLYGFYGQGLIEQIQNIQTEINKLLWVIQRSMHLSGSFKILIENGSKIVKEHLNNELGAIVNYTGTQPSYITPPMVPPELYNHLLTLKNAAFEQSGVSQLSAASKKPDGLNSGKALREYNDIESDRFQVVGQNYEKLFLDVADLMITEAKKLYEEDKKFSVNVPGKKFIETIKWKEVDMEEDQYSLQAFPVSKLPDDPAGRLQTIQEMLSAGLISPQSGRRLLDYPDLDAEESLANAEEDLLHMMLEKIVEEGEEGYQSPEPTDNLQLAQKLVLEYIAKGRREGLEDEKLEMLRTWNTQVQLLVQSASQPAQQPLQGPQGAPPANPQAPPTSDLLNATNSPTPQI